MKNLMLVNFELIGRCEREAANDAAYRIAEGSGRNQV
jgi:hypothetical protein